MTTAGLTISLPVVQGLFYLFTGVWPLVSIGSFQKITGSKTDLWLVKTTGGLIAVVGGVLLTAGLRNRVTPEIAGLALGSAAFLTAIDVNYVAKGRISRIYLLDAVAETALVAAWLSVRKDGSEDVRSPAPTCSAPSASLP